MISPSDAVKLFIRISVAIQRTKFTTILKTFLIILLVITGFACFENREPLYKKFVSTSRVGLGLIPEKLHIETENNIKKLVDKNEFIGAISLVNANFSQNERISIYNYADDSKTDDIIKSYIKNKEIPTPIFYDKDTTDALENNKRMISIINSQFTCSSFSILPISKKQTYLKDKIKMVCSLSIPPYFGYFSGYITFFLVKEPDIDELDELRSAARILSFDIYDREIK